MCTRMSLILSDNIFSNKGKVSESSFLLAENMPKTELLSESGSEKAIHYKAKLLLKYHCEPILNEMLFDMLCDLSTNTDHGLSIEEDLIKLTL